MREHTHTHTHILGPMSPHLLSKDEVLDPGVDLDVLALPVVPEIDEACMAASSADNANQVAEHTSN